jgi:hypothetical protein
MTVLDMYETLYAWMDLVLNTGDNPLGISIIQSHQNKPTPLENYLVIGESYDWRTIGHANTTDIDTDKKSHFIDYEVTVVFWEVKGSGDALRYFRQSLEWQSASDFLGSKGLSFYRSGIQTQMPRLSEKTWIKEQRLEVIFGVRLDFQEVRSWIEKVEVHNQIGA